MSRLRTLIGVLGVLVGCSTASDDGASSSPLTAAPFFGGDTINHAVFAADVSVWETPLSQSEMDCFWASGVRHVVVGTQDASVASEQLAMAVSRGMTVDAYVYLYWNQDIATQVNAAFAMTKGFPIGRMWLDIEQKPGTLGSNAIIPLIQQGLDACNANGGVVCGMYTGPGFWKSYVSNTTTFADVPLWYALYNDKRSLSDWSTEHFGGWTSPVGKQFQTAPLCGVGGADWDVMQVSAQPTVVVDRTLPPDTGLPPPAPGGLYPADGSVVPIDYVKLMSATIPRATLYQLALETYDGTAWAAYYTWSSPNAFVKVTPPAKAGLYRFRARAENAHGWGAWAAYASFDYGTYTGPRPNTAPSPPPTQSNDPPPPPPPGVPGSLVPDGDGTVTTPNVAMSCSAVSGATSYQFAIESSVTNANAWVAYYTYTAGGPAETFYPQTLHEDYRFRVRAMVSGAYGAWSSYATFHMQ